MRALGQCSTLHAAAAVAAVLLGAEPSLAAETAVPTQTPATVRGGIIAYALTHRVWAIHQTPDGKAECPNGFNDGPREQFAQLFPNDGKQRTLLETQLKREGETWLPSTAQEQLPFKEAGGKTSPGMDLDGKVKVTDFTSPDGKAGIDNQLFRALGCISNYRGPEGTIYHFEDSYVDRYNYNRLLIEISGVDSLNNDDDVTVKSYRGLDKLLADSTGSGFIPGATQRVDMRWGKFAEATWKGKIVDGVLVTEPSDVKVPWSGTFGTIGDQKFRGLRFELKLTPERASGLMAGYVDVAQFYHQLNTAWSTHLQSYGQQSAPSLYRALRRLADGYPDAKTGEMTAISSAITAEFVQVYLNRPPGQTVESESGRLPSQRSR